MAACSAVCVMASSVGSLALYVVAFLALFGFSGIGNGSTYRMIPAIFKQKADAEFGTGTAAAANWARRVSGAVIGLVSAIGALGGIGINLAFRQSFGSLATGTPAFVGFLVFYALCCGLTYAVYLRPAADPTPAYQQV
jgi:NNP family nitrate/nitrite transporter-like MFS transporter